MSGQLEKIDDETIEITELPIRKWTIDYKAMLDSWVTATDKVPATIRVSPDLHANHTLIHLSPESDSGFSLRSARRLTSTTSARRSSSVWR